MARQNNDQDSSDRRRLRKRTLPKAQFDKLIAFIERHRAGRTNVEIGKIANVTPSTITMILKRERVPSVKVIRQLAKALRPANSRKSLEEFTDEFLKLAMYEPSVVADIGLPDSISKELDHLRVAYIVNEPFVDKHWRGFAADLFDYVVDLIKGNVDIRVRREPNQLQELMERREADVVVSAIFPTFQRDLFMDFSKPFPYLRVPLSALIRKGTKTIDGPELTLGQVLNWTKQSEGLRDVRMLLVNGEVGHDFVTTFLKEVKPAHYELTDTLDPNDIYHQLRQKPSVNLFLANMVTCSSVYELARDEFIPLPDDQALTKDQGASPPTNPYAGFPILAMYPVTFGLPEGDTDWKAMIDGALDSLMSEGASLLVSLYKTYLERDRRFAGLCNPEDDLVTSEALKEMFRSLFEAHGLLKVTEAPAAIPQDKVQKAKK